VKPGGTPSSPTKGSNSHPTDQMHQKIRQALLSPAAAKAVMTTILAQFPNGGDQLSDAIASAVEQDPGLSQAVVEAALTANSTQQQALGTGLANAAVFFANSGTSTAIQAQEAIQAAMANAPGLTQTAFTNSGGTNALITSLTGTNSNLTTNNCVSPSRPGNGC
jgi:hypothetical protein